MYLANLFSGHERPLLMLHVSSRQATGPLTTTVCPPFRDFAVPATCVAPRILVRQQFTSTALAAISADLNDLKLIG